MFTTPTAVAGAGFSTPFVGVSIFPRTISQKPMQLGAPNLTHKCSMWTPGNLFILRSKGQRSRSWVIKSRRHGSLHSCECWLLLYFSVFTFRRPASCYQATSHDWVFTDHFSGSGRAIDLLCVCVCLSVCPNNNFWTKWPLTRYVASCSPWHYLSQVQTSSTSEL